MKKKTPTKRRRLPLPTIYIQIASYRDPELLPTIKDCIANAKHPKKLRFGIAWQHSPYEEWDNLNDYMDDSRFNIIDIDYREAMGPCVARYQLNKAYNGETYTLQLDSHHRFIKNWDVELVKMLEETRSDKHPKPLLTSYLPSYNPANDPAERLQTPWIMEFDRFAPEGPVHFLPHHIDNFAERTSPLPARFVSGHFIFADGKFCREVEYDPEYYFHGEEINLSVRAYMAGYDLFAPHKVLIWHEYTRNNKKKHWDDHPDWNVLDKSSYAHNRALLGMEGQGSDDLVSTVSSENVRSLQAYEKYAGLEFSTRRVHELTLQKLPPPISDIADHESGLRQYHKICIDIYKPTLAETDYVVWAVAFEDKNGVEIYREDVNTEEIERIMAVPFETDNFIHVWRTFESESIPTSWVLWPYSESKEWMDRLTGPLGK